ncbi:hypothetical protein Q7P37_002785 [Cladosporium fusiforme]
MSGIEAVGLAAAIVQFVDLGSKLLITGYEIYKSHEGATINTIHLQTVCAEINNFSEKLSILPPKNTRLSPNEEALWSLADRANNLSWHLGLFLGDLKQKKDSFRSWGALRQSWRLLRKKETIDGMVAQLKEIKSLLDTRLLMLLRDDNALVVKLINEEIRASKHAHDDNIALLQTLKRELLATVRRYDQSSLASAQHSSNTLLQTIGDQISDLASRSVGLSRSERILGSLCFDEIGFRKDQIEAAVTGTCSWAFGSWDVKDYGTGNHFISWLEQEASDPFMITGKPGSGKSTLMKFVSRHEETRKALERWSCLGRGGKEACVQRHDYKPWTMEDIFSAFHLVMKTEIENLDCNFCFFIDGLDEYEGPGLELVRQLKMLSSSSRVKLCLASRPRNVFQQHFPNAGPYYLELHHHTQGDMRRLVKSKFKDLGGLIDVLPAQLSSLQEAVVEKSDGVFLWVVLVLRELVKGLEPPYTTSELMERLSIMPPTLDTFFQRILDQVHVQYRRFTARLLLMSIHRLSRGLSLQTVHFLWHSENNQEASHIQISVPAQEPFPFPMDWEKETAMRMQKCCGDFLHVVAQYYGQSHAEHVHKSVADFLNLGNVNAHLFVLAGWHDAADVHLAFCQSYIHATSADHVDKFDRTYYTGLALEFAAHAYQYETYSETACTEIVHQFDKACSLSYAKTRSGHWFDEAILSHHESTWLPPRAAALLTWASLHGLSRFVEEDLNRASSQSAAIISQFLLQTLLLRRFRYSVWNDMPSARQMLAVLCTKGACINIPVQYPTSTSSDGDICDWRMSQDCASSELDGFFQTDGLTVWEAYLHALHRRPFAIFNKISEGIVRIEAFLELGADLNCKFPGRYQNIEQATLEHFDRWLFDSTKGRIRTALLKRGYTPMSTNVEEH